MEGKSGLAEAAEAFLFAADARTRRQFLYLQ